MATWTGFEPVTSAVTGQHSRPLNYQAISKAHYSFTLPFELSAKKWLAESDSNRQQKDYLSFAVCAFN